MKERPAELITVEEQVLSLSPFIEADRETEPISDKGTSVLDLYFENRWVVVEHHPEHGLGATFITPDVIFPCGPAERYATVEEAVKGIARLLQVV